MFENKKIYILGAARSGYEVAKLLAFYNNQIVVSDIKDPSMERIKEFEGMGVHYQTIEHQEDLLDETFDYVIKSPGLKLDHPCVVKALQLGVKVINEVEVAYHFLPKDVQIVGVTGSNGKTTTTTLIYEFLHAMGLPVHLGGNIGFPLSSLINDIEENDILVLEISAQQLHDFDDFKTNISVLTNLTEVHLDHFGTYENYKQEKRKIFRHHTDSDIAIINRDDQDCVALTEDLPSQKFYFSSTNHADCYLCNGFVYYRAEPIMELEKIRIQGIHNYENIMCAILVAKQYGISNDVIEDVLTSFVGVEHRIEFVRRLEDREFYNDSKSTNVKSTQIALKAFTKPTILLLGGLDRGHSFTDLTDYLGNTRTIVCYGETKDRILEYANSIAKDCVKVDNLEEAVKVAYQLSMAGDIILLSPACASWDQYDNFETRGDEFKKIVENLK